MKEELPSFFAKFPGEFEGLKIRTSKNIVKEFGFKSLDRTLEIADKIGVPIMVHCTNPPGPLGEVIRRLRPGDVLTHMYQNIGSTLIDEHKKVIPEAYAARERGVILRQPMPEPIFPLKSASRRSKKDSCRISSRRT